ncbi:Ribophorin I [Hyphopichia burtonii NRRL Y-1933]|uniref:Dolichyl-diphosphooligosaccharide--protein glycosyltransferase subunit 1 n=1 Tax=Hyphopichia burtonii NRRL Y-1933 TaxID=984485 RepID=A0A1E4RST5_9ASCO|nr:Ribophorin I [Hyphopichia burtonii NRRL Y-1933]ODV70271.1 Ribophorin I [Hyphopichia burtonii NRRL Y-1933]
MLFQFGRGNAFMAVFIIGVLMISRVQSLLIDPASIAPHWENVHYLRSIDLTRGYVRETDLIEIKNIDSKPQREYTFTINDGFEVVPKVSILAVSLVDKAIEVEPTSIGKNIFKFKLPFPIAPNQNVEIKVRYIYTNALTPLPAKIAMDEKQNLLAKLNKLPYSPYPTKEYSLTFTGLLKGQEMQLNLPNLDEIKASSDYNVPSTLKPRVEDKSLKYGPIIDDIPSFSIEPMGLLYEHNRPIAKVNNLQRSIWLPASGVDQLSIEEYYELTNDAAELSSGFSRVDYMKGRYEHIRKHFSISHLEIPLTSNRNFDDYYYTDHVGVVSTHQVAQNHLILQPRFPIFGGWNYNFTLGWNNKFSDFVHKVLDQEDTYIIKVPLLNTVRDVFYDNAYINFYLPENAEFVNVSSPIDFESVNVDNELSYLDVSKGHVKVTVHFKDLIDDLHKLDLFVSYKYTPSHYWTKVLKIAAFAFVGLTSYYLIGLIDISIDKEHKSVVEENN